MPDIPFFDAIGFFAQKISEVEQSVIGKKAEAEILQVNQRNITATIASLSMLSPHLQQPIQAELASLKEVLTATERSIIGLAGEIEILTGKLIALQTARSLLETRQESP